MSGWVVLPTTRGPVVTRAEAVGYVIAPDYSPIPFAETGVEVQMLKGPAFNVLPLDGESPGDALARVCGLLGIEVQR